MTRQTFTRYYTTPFDTQPTQPDNPQQLSIERDLVCYWLPLLPHDGLEPITLFLASGDNIDVLGPFDPVTP